MGTFCLPDRSDPLRFFSGAAQIAAQREDASALAGGAGVTQINSGLNFLLGVPNSPSVQLMIIALVTGLATLSVLSGLDRGVRILSELNLLVAILLMLFVLLVGPTAELMRDFVQKLGLYLDSILLRTFNIYAYDPAPWIDAWTLFYWA